MEYIVFRNFLFVQTFFSRKDHISKVYNSKAKMKRNLFISKSIHIILVEFSTLKKGKEARGLQIELESLNYKCV